MTYRTERLKNATLTLERMLPGEHTDWLVEALKEFVLAVIEEDEETWGTEEMKNES